MEGIVELTRVIKPLVDMSTENTLIITIGAVVLGVLAMLRVLGPSKHKLIGQFLQDVLERLAKCETNCAACEQHHADCVAALRALRTEIDTFKATVTEHERLLSP